MQRWIERLGTDSTIPTFSEKIVRRDNRYPNGGGIVHARDEIIPPGYFRDYSYRLNTTGYPPGQYRFSLEFRPLAGQPQTVGFDFTVQ